LGRTTGFPVYHPKKHKADHRAQESTGNQKGRHKRLTKMFKMMTFSQWKTN